MNLSNIRSVFAYNGCLKIYVKRLSANDNSKNQVYLARGSWEILNIFPLLEIRQESAGTWEKERFKASINFFWLGEEGELIHAPRSQFILYPKYPEIRFSGFLKQCETGPSSLMTERLAGRLLFLSPTNDGRVLGYVAAPDSEVIREFNEINKAETVGVFAVIDLQQDSRGREILLSELYRIHKLDWITSKSLTRAGEVPCTAPQCGGYTLEAELGILRNGYAEPDFMGWEVKNFGVASLRNLNSRPITLFTPEPTGGIYKNEGAEKFVISYGYADKLGRQDRRNFGGVHKIGERHNNTKLTLKLIGFDNATGKIRNTDGKIVLLDDDETEAASWSFSSLLLHWNKKHNQACYVPSLSDVTGNRRYKYGDTIILGIGTEFQFFLSELAKGNIYYDPGIKLENVSTAPKIKKRSQFRIKSQHVRNLYKRSEVLDLSSHYTAP